MGFLPENGRWRQSARRHEENPEYKSRAQQWVVPAHTPISLGNRLAALFYVWASDMQQSQTPFFAVPWDSRHPRTTPSGLANPQAAVLMLQNAANTLLSRVGSLDITWGTVFRLNCGSVNLPASGDPGDPFGIFRTLYFTPNTNGQYRVVSGDSYIAAVEFTTPMRARVLLTYGNSSQPGSVHNGDQLMLYAKDNMRDAWLTLPAIEAHLASYDNLFF